MESLVYSFPLDDNDRLIKPVRIESSREGPVCTFYIVKI
jgi:hypothetical protein